MQSYYESYFKNYLISTNIGVKLGTVHICIWIGIVLHIIILAVWIGIGVGRRKHTINWTIIVDRSVDTALKQRV